MFGKSWISKTKQVSILCLLLIQVACSSSQDSSVSVIVEEPPQNTISQAYFRDSNGNPGELGGVLFIRVSNDEEDEPVSGLRIYWLSDDEQTGESWFEWQDSDLASAELASVSLPESTLIPSNVNALKVYLFNDAGESNIGAVVRFHDFKGNAQLSGPGGNEENAWVYGQDRPQIPIYRKDSDCVLDNGLVSVIDMENTRDESNHVGSDKGLKKQSDDIAYPAYSFQCEPEPINDYREISDEYGVWTYSTLNDSMYYGTVTYDAFLKHLGEPPLEEKIRLRVHYGSMSSMYAFWDGAYANFSDAYPFFYSMASLDAIAHEVAHGVLNRIADLDFYEAELSTDVRTVHEAFSDISALVVKYEFNGHSDHWIHDEGLYYYARHLDKIVTETGAIESYLDYDDAGENFYKRIGMMTYPFYFLSQQWGIEHAYQIYVKAARTCWFADMTLPEAASCIKQTADSLGHDESIVVAAFKTVKIKLFDEGVLSHFNFSIEELLVNFTDNSQSTSSVSEWYWDFGDGATSREANPSHQYEETGEYQVRLRVVGQNGDVDTMEKRVVVPASTLN